MAQILKRNDEAYIEALNAELVVGEDVHGGQLFDGLNESELITEATAITFDNKTYPKDGWMVIMAGGAGSGKGATLNNQILIDAKIIDVDKLKTLYNGIAQRKNRVNAMQDEEFVEEFNKVYKEEHEKLLKKGNLKAFSIEVEATKAAWKALKGKYPHVAKEYNFKNEDDVSALHDIIGAKRTNGDKAMMAVDDAQKDAFFKSVADSLSRGKGLPNVVLDITGKSKVDVFAKQAKDLGYKVSVVWVLTNRQWAMFRNLSRARTVKQEIFHSIHNQVKEFMTKLILDESLNANIDELWMVFSGKMGDVQQTKKIESIHDLKDTAFKMKRVGGKFEFPNSEKELELLANFLGVTPEDISNTTSTDVIKTFLGPDELDPKNPQTYKEFTEFKDNMANMVGNTSTISGLRNMQGGDEIKDSFEYDLAVDAVQESFEYDFAVDAVEESFDYDVKVANRTTLADKMMRCDEKSSIEDIKVAFTLFANRYEYVQEAVENLEEFIEKAFVGEDKEGFKEKVREYGDELITCLLESVEVELSSKLKEIK